MASTKNYLYSVGPGSVGPGTHITRSLLNPQRNRGVITRMHQNESGITPAALASLYTLSESAFPGTSILLDSTFVRQLSDTVAVIVSRYGSGGTGSGFKTVMTRTPGGSRQADYYNVSDEYTSDTANYIGPPEKGVLKPERVLTFPLITVSWSTVVFQDSRPSDNKGLVFKHNSNAYTIDGYSHAKQSLRFGGTRIRHDKYGAYDRWLVHHTAYYDPRGLWRTGAVVKGEQRDDGSGTYAFTLANGGNGIDTFAPEDLVSFPNLP